MRIDATFWTDDDGADDAPRPALCVVCQRPRGTGMADAIAHAPCDQHLARLDPDTEGQPTFWGSVGRAAAGGA